MGHTNIQPVSVKQVCVQIRNKSLERSQIKNKSPRQNCHQPIAIELLKLTDFFVVVILNQLLRNLAFIL